MTHRLMAVLLVVLVGCATQQYEIEWLHDDPSRVLQSDTYDCKTIVMQRRSGDAVYDEIDIISNNMGFEVGLEGQIDECLIQKFGWTRIARAAK